MPPIRLTGYTAFEDKLQPLRDIHDGWGWRSVQAGLERQIQGSGSIEDVDVMNLDQRFVALPLGLMLMINIDWCTLSDTKSSAITDLPFRFGSTKSGRHSSGAVYITICNNPRQKRFRRDETILACVIPGPNEPSLEQLNSVLMPFIRDMKKLANGIFKSWSNLRLTLC